MFPIYNKHIIMGLLLFLSIGTQSKMPVELMRKLSAQRFDNTMWGKEKRYTK